MELLKDEKGVSHPHRTNLTKIVCTIGPNTNSPEMLAKLLDAGMNVCRMNFSHGDHKFHGSIIDNVRKAVQISGINCAIMLDTKGPEIRTCKLKDGVDVELKQGNQFKFTPDESYLGDEHGVGLTYPSLASTVDVGFKILVDDGLIAFNVDKVEDNIVYTTILNDGMLGQNKGVNLPGCKVDLPAITEKDKADILFGVERKIDFIAASFIRKKEDVYEIRKLLGDSNIKIISKIENEEGLQNFEEILEASDGIMVARGDLGVEIDIQRVAMAQKMMIRECNLVGKPVITATQMLESMVSHPRPTRAEATDVANAVFDGTDCVMLSGETAKGKFPVECVKTMAKICLEAEKQINYRALYTSLRKHVLNKQGGVMPVPESIASSAVKTSWDLNASLIIVLSDSGNTVRFVSKYRPHTPILCITSTEQTTRQILMTRGAMSFASSSMEGTDSLVEGAIAWATKKGYVKSGEIVVTTSGHIEGMSGSTNILKVGIAP